MPLSRRQFAAGGLAAFAPRAAAQTGRRRPPLLLLLIAEQFRPDYLLRNQDQFVKGGFRRLLDEGSVYLDCRNLSSTFTSSALATIATGCYPSTHGLVANHWFDSESGERIRAGQTLLFGTTVGDEIAQAGGRVYGVAPEDADAGLLAGGKPEHVFSMDARGQFVARDHLSGDLAWLPAFQRSHDPDQVRGARWLALGAPAESAALRVLEYEPSRPDDFSLLFKASPFAQASTFDLVREIVEHEKLGKGQELDCLAVVSGSMAALGHETGADSPLMDQLVLHLDRSIEATLDYLNQARGPGNYAVVFTAAHGAPRLYEPRRAISGEALAKTVDAALGGDAVERYIYPFLYLRPGPRTRGGRMAAARSALKAPGVVGFFTADGDCSHHGEWRERFANSFHAQRSGDVMLAYAPGYVEEFGAGRGVSYGSLYNYDAKTPLIFYGPQFMARRVARTVELTDVAPTLAQACGFPLPSSTTGRVLEDALRSAGVRQPNP
jgi:predicted AlkP superfamily pyrophosphatase or phosphodiesterase